MIVSFDPGRNLGVAFVSGAGELLAGRVMEPAELATLELPEGATLDELVRAVAQRHDNSARRFFVDDDGNAQPTLMLVVNNRQVPAGTRQELADGDEVVILQPISGG